MKLPWHFYLAFKQLFPTGRWVSFFSVLAIVGVALGVNVMIVVVAFMKGFQSQFRDDILDSYGEIRAMARVEQDDWRDDMRRMQAIPEVKATTPFMQGFSRLLWRHACSHGFGSRPGERRAGPAVVQVYSQGIDCQAIRRVQGSRAKFERPRRRNHSYQYLHGESLGRPSAPDRVR